MKDIIERLIMLDALKSLAQEQAKDQMAIYQTIIDGSILAANAIKNIGNKGVTNVFNLKPPSKAQMQFDDPLDEPMEVGQRVDLGKMAQQISQERMAQQQTREEPRINYDKLNEALNEAKSKAEKERILKEKTATIGSQAYNAIDHFRLECEKMTTNIDIVIKQFMAMKNQLYQKQLEIYELIQKMDKE